MNRDNHKLLQEDVKHRELAASLERASSRLEKRARDSGLAADFSGIDHIKLAAETMDETRDVAEWIPPAAPSADWLEVERDPRGGKYRNAQRSLTCILSCARENDGRAWLHLSLSHRTRIPTWGELGVAKEQFLGDREAYQILPPRKRYVNIHPFVLNLFALLDPEAAVLPDFTRGTGGI